MEGENYRGPAPYLLRLRAAFSCFGVSDHPDYPVPGVHSKEYLELLLKERKEVERLCKWANLKMIIWPKRPYNEVHMRVRFGNLIKFLRENEDFDKVQVALGKYRGGNRYICDQNVLITGIRGSNANQQGYDLTWITYHGPTISAAITEFDLQFEEFWAEHVKFCGSDDLENIRSYVVNQLERMATN